MDKVKTKIIKADKDKVKRNINKIIYIKKGGVGKRS